MTKTDYYGGDRTCVEAYHSDGRLTSLAFWAEGVSETEIELGEPYDKEMVKRIADLYNSEEYCSRDDFHEAIGTADTLKDVLERLDGTFDYREFFDGIRRIGHEILLSLLKESTQAMLDSLDQYDTVDWARYIRLNS